MNATTSAQREQCEELAKDLESRGRLSPLVVDGQSFASAYALTRYLQSAGPALVEGALRQLTEQEDRAIEAERRAAAEVEREEAELIKRSPLSADEQAVVDEANEERRQIAARENSTEARLGRIESVLERIATSLEKR